MAAPAEIGSKTANEFGLGRPGVFSPQSVTDYERQLRSVINTKLPVEKRNDLIESIDQAAKIYSVTTKFQALEAIAFRFVQRCEKSETPSQVNLTPVAVQQQIAALQQPVAMQPQAAEQALSSLLYRAQFVKTSICNLRNAVYSTTEVDLFAEEYQWADNLKNQVIPQKDLESLQKKADSLFAMVGEKDRLVRNTSEIAKSLLKKCENSKFNPQLLALASKIVSKKFPHPVHSTEFDQFLIDFVTQVNQELRSIASEGEKPVSEEEKTDFLFWTRSLKQRILSINAFTGQSAFTAEYAFVEGLENRHINKENFQNYQTIITALYKNVNDKSELIYQAMELAGKLAPLHLQTPLSKTAGEILHREISKSVDSVEFDDYLRDFIDHAKEELYKNDPVEKSHELITDTIAALKKTNLEAIQSP